MLPKEKQSSGRRSRGARSAPFVRAGKALCVGCGEARPGPRKGKFEKLVYLQEAGEPRPGAAAAEDARALGTPGAPAALGDAGCLPRARPATSVHGPFLHPEPLG